jgi:signal transduction histidine kinase
MLKLFANREVTMRDRFIFRVLLPPFILLLIIGGIGFWQLNKFLTSQAIDDLKIAASASAIRLERELAIRATVLENTGEEIAAIKNTYITDLTTLENNRSVCREYYLENFTFNNSPNDVCETFAQNLAGSRASLQAIEDIYIERAKQLQSIETTNINQRLSAYKQFFPETLATLVIGSDEQILSSAVSGDANISPDELTQYAVRAIKEPVKGEILQIESFDLAIFAFPTSEGSVLAAYDSNNVNFVLPSWKSTPIDNNEALAIIVEKEKNIIYPGLKNKVEFLSKTASITDESNVNVKLNDVQNIVVGNSVGGSNWTVMVASPEAIVFSPLRDTQIAVVFLAGLFIIGFLWVGTYFIKKTTDNMAQLVTGAMVFGSGRLDYKLKIDSTEKEFKQLADTMNYMAKRIAQSEKEKDERNKEFISIATHELRAPMTSIIGYLSMLKENVETKLNKQDTMLINTAYDGTIRLRDLVNDMLDAARLEGGREEFNYINIGISTYVKDCLDSMKIVAEENSITLKYKDKHKANVYVDEQKLIIILNNFVSNAIKYNHKNGKVNVSHSSKEGQLVTSIASTGPTIPADQQAHMFEKFFRVDTPEHRKVTGTGVGMYVTKQYVEAMGGKTWFTSNPGEDTVFYFSLPIADKSKISSKPSKVTPKQTDSKWIMRWRRRMR